MTRTALNLQSSVDSRIAQAAAWWSSHGSDMYRLVSSNDTTSTWEIYDGYMLRYTGKIRTFSNAHGYPTA